MSKVDVFNLEDELAEANVAEEASVSDEAGMEETENTIDSLTVTAQIIESAGEAAAKLVESGVDVKVAADAITPIVITALEQIDGEMAEEATVEMEADEDGKSFFSKVKNYVIKIYDAIVKYLKEGFAFLSNFLDRFFDGVTKTKNAAEKMLSLVKNNPDWTPEEVECKTQWMHYGSPITASSAIALTKKQKELVELANGAIKQDEEVCKKYFTGITKFFQDNREMLMEDGKRFKEKFRTELMESFKEERQRVYHRISPFFKIDKIQEWSAIGYEVELKDSGILTQLPIFSAVKEARGTIKLLSKKDSIDVLSEIIALLGALLEQRKIADAQKKFFSDVVEKELKFLAKTFPDELQTKWFNIYEKSWQEDNPDRDIKDGSVYRPQKRDTLGSIISSALNVVSWNYRSNVGVIKVIFQNSIVGSAKNLMSLVNASAKL